jgi:hypothetical protein
MRSALYLKRGALVRLAAVLCFSSPACLNLDDYLSDRFKTCEDVRVALVNSEQTRSAYYVLGPGERATHEKLLDSGGSRTLVMCLEIGHGYKFRAETDDGVVGVGQCPASRRSYEGVTVSVVWTPVGFQCVNW